MNSMCFCLPLRAKQKLVPASFPFGFSTAFFIFIVILYHILSHFANAVLFLLRLFFPQTSVYFADKSAENFFFHLVVGKKEREKSRFCDKPSISASSIPSKYENAKSLSVFAFALSRSFYIILGFYMFLL